jgi:membrane protein DedA with SNARE-associated domain
VSHLHDLAIALIDHYGYGGLFVALVLANVGAPIGAEIITVFAGGLTATGHLPFLWLTILVAVLGEVVGATIGYLIGRFGGRPLVDRYGRYLHLTHENLDKVHAFFERYGSFSVFICRFIPVIRGIVAIPAGLAEMNLAHFYFWYTAGSLIFCGGLILLGSALGKHMDAVTPLLHKGGLVVLVVALIVIVAIWMLTRARRSKPA